PGHTPHAHFPRIASLGECRHVLEVYGLTTEIRTSHLQEFVLELASQDGRPLPVIKWVDDNHALLVCPDGATGALKKGGQAPSLMMPSAALTLLLPRCCCCYCCYCHRKSKRKPNDAAFFLSHPTPSSPIFPGRYYTIGCLASRTRLICCFILYPLSPLRPAAGGYLLGSWFIVVLLHSCERTLPLFPPPSSSSSSTTSSSSTSSSTSTSSSSPASPLPAAGGSGPVPAAALRGGITGLPGSGGIRPPPPSRPAQDHCCGGEATAESRPWNESAAGPGC
ncbi:hypothetical protein Vretifemale_9227, partial [Volvox reticuliferus]